MKTKILITLCMMALATLTRAATPDELVAQGRALLVQSNLAGANTSFNAALAAAPDHAEANLLAAATRLLLLPQQPAVSNFLNRLGISSPGRDLYNWVADFQHDPEGNVILPNTINSTEGINLYRNTVMPALRASQTNLATSRRSSTGLAPPISC